MSQFFLHVLDIFFVVFHSVFILFILFGWIYPKWRIFHLAAVLLTGISWFILGIFYGLGYCPLTDWHWSVLRQLERTDLTTAYVQYILDRLLGIQITPSFSDIITLLGWLAALIISVYLQYRKRRKKHKKQTAGNN